MIVNGANKKLDHYGGLAESIVKKKEEIKFKKIAINI